MKYTYRIFFLLLTLPLPRIGYSQVVVTNGASVTILSGETVTLSGINLQNNAGGTIQHNGTLIMQGNASNRDIINHGNFDGGNAGTIEMRGVNEQQIQGSSVINIYNFIIDNNGGGVSLSNTGGLRVHNTISLTNGHLFTANNSPLYLTPTAANPVETNANHIRGTVVMEARNVGSGAFNFLMMQMPAGADVGNLTLIRRSGNGSTTGRGFTPTKGQAIVGGNQSIAAHWQISTTNTTGNRDVSWSWLPAWDNGKFLSQMQIWATSPPLINNNWTLYKEDFLDLSSRTHTENNIPLQKLNNAWTFSDFNNPLPVDLLSFTAKALEKSILLNWSATNAVDFEKFVVERSTNGKDFQPIAEIPSVAASRFSIDHYQYEDVEVQFNRTYYYRLKQADLDGSVKYSAMVHAILKSEQTAVLLYPNPTHDGQINVSISTPTAARGSIEIIDTQGRTVYVEKSVLTKGTNNIPLDLKMLASGTYLLKIITEHSGEPIVQKLVVHK